MAKTTQKSGCSWKSNNKGKDNESNDSKKSNDDQNKTMSCKFYPHSANSQQSVTCDAVRDHVINKMQQQCNQGMDAVKSLRDLQLLDMDTEESQRQISAEAKEADATVQQQTFNTKCKIKLQEHGK